MKNKPPLILAVDDDRTTLMMLEAHLSNEGYEVITATNGDMAQHLILEHNKKLDAVLLDRMMPGADGIHLVKWMNENNHIVKPPIIMQTAAGNPEQIKEGLDAGIFYYLTKPISEEVLKSVVSLAIKESEQRRALSNEISQHRASFKLMHDASFKISTLDEAENLSCFLANSFPDPYRILPAIAELLVNAVEHGNFGISYDEKTQLIADGVWREEVIKRSTLEENKDKFVDVVFSKKGGEHVIKITDQGAGFPWHKFLKVDQSRALDNHGRGIARANMLFTTLKYNESGNQLVAIVDNNLTQNFKW